MDFGDAPPTTKEQFYSPGTVPYFRAPHIYIALVPRLMPGRQSLTEAQAEEAQLPMPSTIWPGRGLPDGKWRVWSDCSETVFMTCRGGLKFDRIFQEAFIRPGIGARRWYSRTNYAGRGIVPTGPTEMSIYVHHHYRLKTNHVERFTLRKDGFVSVHASYAGGELLTKPITFAGKELVLNVSTSAAGSVRVEIRDEAGKAISGFALADCVEIIGDQIEGVVEWKGGCDISRLAGKPVRLRFTMNDADLYSIRFK